MQHVQKHFTFWLLLVLGQALSAHAADAPPPLDPTKPPDVLAQTFVKTYGLDKLKNRKLAITSFGVEFNQKVHVNARSSDYYYNNKTDFVLRGVDDAVFQRIADRAYKKLLEDLGQAGYQVLPAEALQASAAYQALLKDAGAKQKTPTEYKLKKRFDSERDVSASVIAPTGLQYYEPELDEDEGRGPAGDTAQGVLGSLAKNIGNKAGRKVRMHEVEVAKELGATVMKVRYVIGFGDASASVVANTTYKTDYIAEKVVKQLEVNRANSVRSRLSVLGRGETYFAFRTEDANPNRKERTTVHFGGSGLLASALKGTDSEVLDGNASLWLMESVDSGESFLSADTQAAVAAAPEKKESGALSLFKGLGSALTGATASKGTVTASETSSFVANADPDLFEYLASAYLDVSRAMLMSKLTAKPPQ